MSDGTTATTLAPSEDEMSKIADTFGRMRDAVISASQLASEVANLRVTVDGLRREMEDYRQSNRWLDQQVTELRQARDQALRDKSATVDILNEVTKDRDGLRVHSENQREQLARLNDEVARLRKERDDAQFLAEVLREERNELDERIHAIDLALHPVVKEPKADESLPRYGEQPRSEGGQFQPKSSEPPSFYGSDTTSF